MGRGRLLDDAGAMTRFGVPPGSIVVGVDGSEESERAVTWAAEQARLERRVLALVHCSDHTTLDALPWLARQSMNHHELRTALHELGRVSLTRAGERLAVSAPGVEVATALVDFDPRIALEQLSTEAHLVVVGSRGRGPIRSTLLGSVSASVARHARCPVVVCRPPHDPAATRERVVVGADGSAASGPVVEFAFAQASLRGAPLTVMHCFWDLLAATTGPGVVPLAAQADLSDLQLLLAESVAGLAEKYPDVQVSQELARGLVDDCLAGCTPDAALLVVGRADVSGWSRFLHTSCALAVLERASTTVAVVPESN
jgi:nucleotide-binding universal stress UspA family protein